MVSSKADLMAGIIALLPHKIAVLLLLSTMLLEIKSYSRLLHIIAFSSALPLGKDQNWRALTHWKYVINVVKFKFWTQVGIIISGLVTASVHSPWILISLEALGSGAVFYVSCFEMLPEAFQGDWKILKCIFTIIGVSIIAILQIFHSDEHDGHWNAMTIQRYFHMQ